ncbi:PREDICTED: spidroin-2-like [Rhagoletis zephyria]|uniref:spidroin-2-like n=1 Tax=Rhagoletis zephyria TaxID=28612 RepID=UPI00081124E2|nr:PREDICTED: spidroin-2-like [Rhagoletis zephyria]
MYITNPTLPYCGPIGTPLAPGAMIRISGNVSPYATTFAINLQCGPSVNPRDDVALHLSPVFSPPPRIVRNSISGNRWGAEESFGGFPLSAGSSFEFLILVEPSEFRIALNGAHFTEFRHRLPFERITHLALDGDATITTVVIEPSPYSSASAPPMDMGMPMPGAPPYPPGGSGGGMPPPYPPGGSGMGAPPGLYPTLGGAAMGAAAGAASAMPYPPGPPGGPYPPPASGPHGYVPQSMPPGGAYPGAPGGGAYPGGQYPGAYGGGQQYPPPPPGYPQGASGSSGSGIGGKIGAGLGALGLGAAAGSIGSALGFGNKSPKHHGQYPGGSGVGGALGGILGGGGSHGKSHGSNPIPIGKIAVGAGAAALGAAVLTGHHPFKKAKKLFKHKGFKHKGFKHKGWGHKGWSHKGWGSSSSSSSEEEE